ncbi:MAG: hypothetical protein CVT80_12780 [Alphaproteobacteria bacterium HGW-Alphaproteobacteria-2]|nr:MAG: hypothetical protein CVT80_12780 [Alphaproteobacteria bacterium HGW-Alphaproteobacteria-2]
MWRRCDHRVVSYAAPGASARPLPRHPGFARLASNNGLEALAMDASGVLWAIAESSGDWTQPFPVFRFADGNWTQPFGLPRRGPYLAVGAEFGPDGRLYLLERDFAGVLRGVSSRVRAFSLGAEGPLAEEEILVTPHGQFDNLEAIALWQEPGGALRITLLSDEARPRRAAPRHRQGSQGCRAACRRGSRSPRCSAGRGRRRRLRSRRIGCRPSPSSSCHLLASARPRWQSPARGFTSLWCCAIVTAAARRGGERGRRTDP